MKRLLFLLLAFTPILSFAKSRESTPWWYVQEQKKDSSISAKESVIEIHIGDLYDYADDGDGGVWVKVTPQIKYAFNGKMDSMPFPSNGIARVKVKPGKCIGQFYAGPHFYEIKTDSISVRAGYCRPLFLNFESSVISVIEDKPVIYVYSDQPTQVDLQLALKGKMGFTYPAYESGWKFIADKEGNIYANGKTYPYLFWEAQSRLNYNDIEWSEGSIVKRDSLVPFFERSLTAMGLNQKEITDYITYWVPRMSANDSSYIHFMLNEDYDEYARMTISPAPNVKFQVFMICAPAKSINSSDLTPQAFESFTRKGLTVVEWGGTQLTDIPVFFAQIEY